MLNQAPMNRALRRYGPALAVCSIAAVSWWPVQGFESLLAALRSSGLGLVEIGSLGHFRTFRFGPMSFDTHKLADHVVLIGVTPGGNHLVLSVPSKLNDHPILDDTLEITGFDGTVTSKIHPSVRGIVAYYAQMSPDRKSIAFVGSVSLPNERARIGLHLVTVSGEVQMLVPTSEFLAPQSIGWSPDSSSLVYDIANRILIYHLRDGTSAELTPGSSPTWSPDGSWIAYRRRDGLAGLIRPDGSGTKELGPNIHLARGVQWSPDGRYVLYTDSATGEVRVFGVKTAETVTILEPVDQYDESRLRWIQTPATP